MNKSDLLYIKKKFGSKVLAILKRIEGSESNSKIDIQINSSKTPEEVGWVDRSNILTKVTNPFIIEDIEITNDSLSVIVVTTHDHAIFKTEDGWYDSGVGFYNKIKRTTGSTKSNDPLVVDAVKKAVEGMTYGTPNSGTLTVDGVRLKVTAYSRLYYNTLITTKDGKMQFNSFPDTANLANFHV